MMRSMFAGVSGLKNHQTKMDVIGNNISNVNTIGFKGGRANFQDLLNQNIKGATEPRAGRGGTNPIQVGLGNSIATVDVLQTQGNLQNTSKVSDLAIQGDGFFILGDGSNQYYTRAGNFNLEKNGKLVNPANGMILNGWMANSAGEINPNSSITGIQLPIGQNIAPSATTKVGFGGNLDSKTFGTLTYPQMTIDDGAGHATRVSITLTPTKNYNEFRYTVEAPSGVVTNGTGTITLDVNGKVIAVKNNGSTGTVTNPAAATTTTTTTATTTNGAATVAPGANVNAVASSGGAITVTPTGGTAITIELPTVGATNGGIFTCTTPAGKTEFTGAFTAPTPLFTATKIYDSQGTAHTISTTVTKHEMNRWKWQTTDEQGNILGSGNLVFDNTGKLTSAAGTPITFSPAGAEAMTITPDFSGITQFASAISEITSPEQDGFAMGQLQSFNIDKSGQVLGVFSNGRSQILAQLALANFNNPSGLLRSGDTMFAASANSGSPQIGQAGFNGRGNINSGTLEMSNVDLSQEFTDMIVTQRGFQANSRIITTSDEMLQELVNLKR
jgi:flagellar hook protein FlgE